MENIKLEARKIDLLVGKRATLRLNSGKVVSGYCDSVASLPISDDTDEENDFLRFDCDDGEMLYLTNDEIVGMDF